MKNSMSLSKGFTLIEIMVVLTIIGILMGLALTSFMGSRKAARDGKRKADLEQIRSGLEMCRTANVPPSYPATITFGGNLVCNLQTYMSGIPKDPLDPTYQYRYVSDTNIYYLCAYLETGPDVNLCPPYYCGGTRTCNYQVKSP